MIIKKCITIITVIVYFLVLTSCSTPIAEPTPTPEPTAAPIIAPTTEPTSTLEPLTVLESILTEEEKNMMPEVDGLYRTKEDEEYVYRALGDNEYGLGEGEYAGGFKEEVYIEDFFSEEINKIGGIFLDARIVEKMVIKQEQKGSSGFDTVPMPFDISGMKNEIKILLENNHEGPYGDNLGAVKIELSDDKIPIVSICHGLNNYTVVLSGGNFYIVNDLMMREGDWREGLFSKSEDNGNIEYTIKPESFPILYSIGGDFLTETDFLRKFVELKYGDEIITIDSDIYFASRLTPGDDMFIDRALKIEGKWVFVMKND